MTSRTRNLTIIGVMLLLLAGAGFVIATKETKLGLDLRGGIELVYEGLATPQVPEVTPQAIDDAISTMRERVDALGVSEPEIQRSGPDQISVALPDVQNPERAKEQVGTTAQLQFYDWEPNVLVRDPSAPFAGAKSLYQAVEAASKQEGKAEQSDVPPGSDVSPEEADSAERHQAQRPVLPLRARPLPDRPRRPAGPLRALRALGLLRRAAGRVRARAGSRSRLREGHRVLRGARGARFRRPAGRVTGVLGAQGRAGDRGRGGGGAVRAGPALLRDRGRLGAVGHRHHQPGGEHRPERRSRW